jgi:hypothetical protein
VPRGDLVMRSIGRSSVILIGLTGAAQAISLPVDGIYGAGGGCEIVAVHGIDAVIAAGGTESFPESRTKGGEDVIVTPSYATGSDWVCKPGTVDGEYVALECVSWGATWLPMPVAHFEVSGETLRFTMPDEATLTLDRCPP